MMVLGSFQKQGVLLLWHMVGQGPAVHAAVGGWVGGWCWVASSAGTSYYFCIWQGRGLLCMQQVGDVWAVFFILFSSPLSCLPFLMPHLLGDGWTF